MLELSYLPIFPEFDDLQVFAKLEMMNFTGSIKARPALQMIRAAERVGFLDGSKTILEPTSGNTGIALAGIGQLRGHKVTLVVPDSVSQEKKAIMRSFGATIFCTPGKEGMDGAIQKAQKLAKENPKFLMLDQFSNPANVEAHLQTTGPEIWQQTSGRVDYFIAGMGSGGTLMGTGRYLRSQNPNIQVIGVEPFTDTPIPGLKNMTINEVPRIFQAGELDSRVSVTLDEAISMVRLLAKTGALLVGPSSGAALAGILKLLTMNDAISTGRIATIFPDDGTRYLINFGSS